MLWQFCSLLRNASLTLKVFPHSRALMGRTAKGFTMKGRGLMGLLVVGLSVLATIYVYNRFVAKDGKTVADLGRPVAK